MSNLNALEAAALDWVAGQLEAQKAGIEAVTGPFVLEAANAGLKVADAAFANLPFGFGAIIDAALAKYVSMYTSNIAQYEGQGIDALAALLRQIASSL